MAAKMTLQTSTKKMSMSDPHRRSQGNVLYMPNVQPKLDRLLLALANKLGREPSVRAPNTPNPSRTVLLLSVRLARSTTSDLSWSIA